MAKSNTITSMAAQEAEWRAESDLRTLMEAEKIEKDPKRLKAAQALAKKQLLALAGVASEGKDES